MATKMVVTRTLASTEIPWLAAALGVDVIPKGTTVYKCVKPTYGAVREAEEVLLEHKAEHDKLKTLSDRANEKTRKASLECWRDQEQIDQAAGELEALLQKVRSPLPNETKEKP